MDALSVAIMAHPKRKRMVDKLVARLDARPRVVWDQKNDVWDTGRRALLAHGDRSHHLVLQDDVVCHRGLIECCNAILEHVPDGHPVALYMGRWRHRPKRFPMREVMDTAKLQGSSFAVFDGPWWGPGLILPTEHIEAIVKFGDRAKHPNYDIRIAQFYKREGIPCYYTTPSVVDHQPGASLVGRRGTRRHAQWYWDRPYADLDWSRGTITPQSMNLKQNFPVTP